LVERITKSEVNEGIWQGFHGFIEARKDKWVSGEEIVGVKTSLNLIGVYILNTQGTHALRIA